MNNRHAVILTGFMRNYDTTLQSYFKNIIADNKQVDLFIATWDYVGTKIMKIKKIELTDGEKRDVTIKDMNNDKINVEDIQNKFSPKDMKVFNLDLFEESILQSMKLCETTSLIDTKDNGGKPQNYLTLMRRYSCYFMTLQGWKLMQNYSQTHNIKYNKILKIRADFEKGGYYPKINWNIKIPTKTIYINGWNHIDYSNLDKINNIKFSFSDHLAFGNYEDMKIYFNLFDNLHKIVNKFDYVPKKWHQEYCLSIWLTMNNIVCKVINTQLSPRQNLLLQEDNNNLINNKTFKTNETNIDFDKNISSLKKVNNKIIFDKLIDFLNENKIKYVIQRGFQKLPIKPYTDIDMVIHSSDFDKMVTFFNNSKYFRNEPKTKLVINNIKCIYYPYFTYLKNSEDKFFRIDLYNHFFFHYGANKIALNSMIEDSIFNNLIKYKQKYTITNNIWEYYLLLFRCVYDKGGKLKQKHKNRINFLTYQLIYKYNTEFKNFNILKQNYSNALARFESYRLQKKADLLKFKNNEYSIFINWTPKNFTNIVNIIERKYKIVDIIPYNFNSHEERLKKINDIYEVKVKPNDPRIISNQQINIIIVKCTYPIYDNIGKTSHNYHKVKKVVNANMFKLKKEIRHENMSYLNIHGCDELNEANKICFSFNLNKYLTQYTYVPIKFTRGVIWENKINSNRYNLLKIENTPHYKYLFNNKQEYIDYTTKIDIKHSVDRYNNLINTFDETELLKQENCPVCYIMDNGYYLIYDGLHRISLLKYYGYDIVKVKVKFFNEKNIYVNNHALSIEI